MRALIRIDEEKKFAKKSTRAVATATVEGLQNKATTQLTLEQSGKRKATSDLDMAIADLVHAHCLPSTLPRFNCLGPQIAASSRLPSSDS